MNSPNEAELPTPGEPSAGDTRQPRRFGDLQKTITMAQIAKAAGVSQGAISSLLNDRDYGIRVSEKTRERVFKVCREMGYIPNDLRAVVRMYPELGDTCLLFPNTITAGLADPLVARYANAILAHAAGGAQALTVAPYDETRDYVLEPEALPQPVRSGVCSKFIVLGAGSHLLVHALQRRSTPLISLGTDCPLPGVVSVGADYAQASQLAIEHLHTLGHRRIAIVSGPFGSTDPHLIELNRGIRLAFDARQLSLDAGTVVYGDLSEKAGAQALTDLLNQHEIPTAIFCLSATAAVGALLAARSRGLRVPEQLSIVGCGDELRATVTEPALTTVHLPVEEMAAMAVREIETLIQGPAAAEARRVLLPVHLMVRSSTAATLG